MKALYTLLVLFIPFFGFSQAPTSHVVEAFVSDFSPSYLTVNQGDTVYFYGLGQSNAVEVSQQVYEDFGSQSNGGFALYNDGFVVLSQVGTFYYVSTPFAGQGMVGQITVLQSQTLTYVPDDNFELALIDLGYDDVLDNYVVTDSINSVTSLNVGGMQIFDLTGIEDFISLNYLYINNNSISSIDLSSNTLLTYFYGGNNQLTTLDLSNNTNLEYLWCFSNQLSTLDLSNNTNLYSASIDNNEIESIDLSNNLNLNSFYCSNNLLANLDLTNNSYLQSLICSGNQLTTLDLSNNANLESLDVSNNSLYELNLQNGNCQNFAHYWGEPDFPTNGIFSYGNGQLDCILVDDNQCTANWSSQFIDPQHYFSETCSYGGSDQCDLLIDIVTNDINCSSDNGQFVNPNVQGSVSVNLNSSVNLADVVVEIVNLNNQEIFGSILDSFQIYTQILAPGAYLLNAYLPNTNCFYSEYFNIVDYSLDLSYSTTPSSTIYSFDGSIFFNIISGFPDYNVEVYGPNDYYYLATSVNPQFSLDGLETGDYYVYVTDSLDCFESYQIFLNYNPQTFGCTDDAAMNFNSEATVDDGSCNYCSLSLVSVTPTYCNENSASIEVSTFSFYEYDIQILENNNWVDYQQACIEYLNMGAIIGCLPADTFLIIGYSLNNCIDTLASSTINLTSIIENDQLQMTQIDMTLDDVFSDVINIGFDFVYNGVQYDQCLISSNNFLSFNILEANMYSNWSINDAIPSAANPSNAIMAPFQDLNPALGGSIYYTTYGTAPNRVFIIRWKDVPMFSCEQELFSSTLYLYEGSNVIETHIQNKPICSQWNDGASIHGLHNSDGTQATVVFDSFANQFRNYPVLWSATNDSWQFSPLVGAGANGYQVSNIPYGTQYSINADLITTVNGQFGCTDPEALNYSPNSICDDNSCEYPPVLGCNDPLSTNFNELAELNDGSCCYQNSISIVVNTGQEVGQSYWNLVDLNQNDLFFASMEGYPNNTDSVSTDFICMANACYQLNLINWIGGSIEIYSSGYQVLDVEPAIGSDLTTIQFCLPIEQLGCTDQLACNYNPFANQDNGSCAYPQVYEQEFLICDGFELDGVYYQESFVNSETIVLANGCDSVVNTTYTVSYSPEVNMFVDFIDDALTAEATNFNNLLYNWNTDESTQTISIDTNGIYTVTVIDAESLCSSTSSINVSWLDATSIDSYIASVYDFKVYPNPSSSVFNISFYSFNEIDLSVNSILGEKIYFEKVRSNGQAYVQIDLSNYSKGIYNLSIKTPDGLSNHKLILQ